MDTLLSMRVFRQVAECGSFTRAAEKTGISTAMASKHVSRLEKIIGAKLLQRNSRSLSLTEAGEMYFRECSYALDTLDRAAEKAAQGTEEPQGCLKITAPVWFADSLFAGWLAEYLRLYPKVKPEICLNNRHVNLIAEGFDLALRVSAAPAPSLIVRRLGDIRFRLVGSSLYLAEHGTPVSTEDLCRHRFVLPDYVHADNLLKDAAGRPVPLPESVVTADSTLMLAELAAAGCGLAVLPDWVAYPGLLTGRIRTVLPGLTQTLPLYAAYTDRRFLSAKVRSFIDFLSGKMQRHNAQSFQPPTA